MNKILEFETKVLDIDTDEVIARLRALGASEQPEVLMRRWVFDIKSEVLEWIRLRDNGQKVTLTYKRKPNGNIDVGKTIEIETEVSDFDKTAEILHNAPFDRVFYQENRTHIFTLNGVEYSIDSWPMINPYLEVETDSIEGVQKGWELLKVSGKVVGDKDLMEIYEEAGIDIHSYGELKFK